jgi:hypothetical protein
MPRAPLLALALLLAPLLAHADGQDAPTEARSPGAALALSAGTTLAGGLLTWHGASSFGSSADGEVALGLSLVAIGPATGNIYAGDTWNTGFKIRLAAIGGGLVGVGIVAGSDCFIECRGSRAAASAGETVVIASGLIYIAGSLLEIANAPLAAQRHNETHVVIAPLAAAHIAGLAIGGTF